jgi:hypothetical protein
MVELGTHNLCPLTNEVGECILGIAFLRLGLCSRPHERERWLWKAAHARSARPYPVTHHPHRAFGTVNTSDTSPDAHAVQGSLGRVIMALTQHDEVSRNSFVRFSSILIPPGSFTLILANTTNRVGFS